jgi:hypothetical protein
MSFKSKKLRNSARGQDCLVRIPGICNFNPETTILAHVGSGAGMGQKTDDIEATFCCSACHAAIDGQTKTEWTNDDLRLMAKEGAERTRKYWLQVGLIKVAA